VRQKLDKEMTMIAALKQHYEHYHAGNLTALKKLYEYHAENCVKAAELTEDTQQREEYLKLAREWTEAARSTLDMNALDAKYRRNTRATVRRDAGGSCGSKGPEIAHELVPKIKPNQPITGPLAPRHARCGERMRSSLW
jgi:hypothetical protein